MQATVCLLRAGQPNSAGDASKSVQIIFQFSWVTDNSIGLEGLTYANTIKILSLSSTVAPIKLIKEFYLVSS